MTLKVHMNPVRSFFFRKWHSSTIKETLIKNNHGFGLAYPVVLFYQYI